MGLTPYNIKTGASVVANSNGVWANRINQASAEKKASVGKTLKQFNKGKSIGILSGQILTYVVSGKSIDYAEVILETPYKPNFFTTYYRAVVQVSKLDIAPQKATPKLPASVITKAKSKVVKEKPVSADPTVISDSYYDYIPETGTNWGLVAGIVIVVGTIIYFGGKALYNKFKHGNG